MKTKFRHPISLLALSCLVLGSQLLMAQEDQWKASFGKADITPRKPVFMAGYASRDKPFERIESRLFAKAMALSDAENQRVVLITTDLIGFSAPVSEPVCEKIMKATGLGPTF